MVSCFVTKFKSSVFPPESSIALIAVLENLCAFTVSAFSNLPCAKIFTGTCSLWIRPSAFSSLGVNKDRAVRIANFINNSSSVTALSHLTCAGFSKRDTDNILSQIIDKGIKNVLALRGDYPPGIERDSIHSEFKYARDLIEYIKNNYDVCIGGAAYPEGHLECHDIDKNVGFAKEKQDKGADFLITQLFFDNSNFYKYYFPLWRS